MIKLKTIIEDISDDSKDVLYHATFNALIPSISRFGIVPGGKKYQNFPGNELGVYLSDDKNLAVSMVEASENDDIPEEWFEQIVVIIIDPKKLDLSKLEKDPHLNMDDPDGDLPKSFIYKGVVPYNSFIDIVDSN